MTELGSSLSIHIISKEVNRMFTESVLRSLRDTQKSILNV